MVSIGQRFGEVRRLRGETQIVFSRSVGISQSALVAYEQGDRDPPATAIAALCERYRVNSDWILLGAGIPFRASQVEMFRRAIRLAKEILPKHQESPTLDDEIELAALIYDHLLGYGEVSAEKAGNLLERKAANE
ncbi:MAG: hypothetical protein DI568_16845 [Sphingomonas sp.]|nr:MAG: hypothetical protein DI568_16845 [Sphingomonas sp.]